MDITNSIGLLPCPFCGGKAILHTTINFHYLRVAHTADCLMERLEEEGELTQDEKEFGQCEWMCDPEPGQPAIMVGLWNRRFASNPASPAQADLSKRLREAATGGKLAHSTVSNFLLHAAADAIEGSASPARVAAPISKTSLPELRDHFGHVIQTGEAITLSAEAAGALFNAMTTSPAAPVATSEQDALTWDKVADAVADNWPMDKRYKLEEIEERLRAMSAAPAAPDEG